MRSQLGQKSNGVRILRWVMAGCSAGSLVAVAWVVLRYGRMGPGPLWGFYARHLLGRAQTTLEAMLLARLLAMAVGAAVGTVATAALPTAAGGGLVSSILLAVWAVLLAAGRVRSLSAVNLGLLALGTSVLVGRVARDAWGLPRSKAMALAWVSGYMFAVYNPPLPSMAIALMRQGVIPISTFVLEVWSIRAHTMYVGMVKLMTLPFFVAGGAWLASSIGDRMPEPPGNRLRSVLFVQAGLIAIMALMAVLIGSNGWLAAPDAMGMQIHAVTVAVVGGTVGWLLGAVCVPPATSRSIYTWWEVSFALLLLLSSFVMPLIRFGVSLNALEGNDRWMLGLGAAAIGGAALRVGFGLSYMQVVGGLVAAGLGLESILTSTSAASASALTRAAGMSTGHAPTVALIGEGLAFTLLLVILLKSGGWSLRYFTTPAVSHPKLRG